MIRVAGDWLDYECIDAGGGEKLERWGDIILRRPEPIAVWPKKKTSKWDKVHALYHRSNSGGGYWEFKKDVKISWNIKYKDLTFKVGPTSFKHTGLFPEQATNWDFIINKIKESKRKIKVLNLFAYTGGSTVAASYAGADVTHVDASKGINEWAKENAKLSGLENNKVRFLVDDAIKFLEREKRRGNTYDAIIMDPPAYGRGPNGEMWKLEDNLYDLVSKATDILSDNPIFVIINCYTTGLSPITLKNMLEVMIKTKGVVSEGEIGLPITENNMILPCGIYGIWESL